MIYRRGIPWAEVREAAERELYDEQFRAAVAVEKERLRRRKWWHRLFPWVVTINRRA
jgi:hypothetical protein